MSQSDRSTQLASALRAAATHVADLVGGGCALVFAAVPGDDSREAPTRLRAAAGFAAADAAKAAAAAALPLVDDAIAGADRRLAAPLPELGRRGAAETIVLPLAWDGRALGALVVGAPHTLTKSVAATLTSYAEHLALRLDHARIATRASEANAPAPPVARPAPGVAPNPGGDELLRLSEALFAQDIELLRSNEKLGKIEKLKNDFIEKMSRELRTPLNSIIEAIIGVLAGENERISDASKESLRTALDEGTAFQRTLQNILDLWRIKQNELPLEVQDVNVAEVVEEAIFSVQDSIGDKPLEIVKDVDPALPKIRTDLAKINQVLFLLLENAVKFTPKGTVTIGAHLEGETLVCRVSDTGIGICADDRQYVFDEFFQVDAHASSAYRGAGLGLSLVRDLVVLLDGQLSLDSDVGCGTTVQVELPVERA
ncbi:MAG: HAMP domain-containing sensor histidine kinase [Myxococcota bacterium]